MRKILTLLPVAAILTISNVNAQNYKTAFGLQIDLGDGATIVGPSIKHFFQKNSAIQGEVLFGNGFTVLQAFYTYQKALPNAKNIDWYIGGGPSLAFNSKSSAFFLRPIVGLDYKTSSAPLALSFDWRPMAYFGKNGSLFGAARFGIGIKYVLK